MKNLFLSIMLFLAVLSSQAQTMTSATLQISGLTCSMCQKSTYKALLSLPFVKSIETDLAKAEFILQFKTDVAVDPDLISKEVEDAGFAIAGLTIAVSMPKVSIEKDQHLKIGQRWYHFVNSAGKTVEGVVNLQFIDKHFVEDSQFLVYSNKTDYGCYKTGKMAACCHSGDQPSGRIYHVTL